MRSSVLISRIVRLVETGGATGEGAALADEYAGAVRKVNSRLDAVVAAADAKSISDAIRLLSEEPPLLEEVSTLDFLQLADWESLCDMNGWTAPPRIDKNMSERAVEIGDAKDAIEPLLAMYKKAVRVDDPRLAVKSLRRLSDIDHSQDWSRNLRQSERKLQSLLIDEFLAAKRDGKSESCDALAQELIDTPWLDGMTAKGSDEVREYWERREAERREAEGREDVSILRKCLRGKWDRKLALSLVRAVDDLLEKGWRIPDEDKCVVDDCRARCAREIEQEEAEKRWREVNEVLHAAIQMEDCTAIRDALAAPEFLDRDPIDGMLSQAQTVLEHAEAARRRKTMQIAVFSFLGVLAVLGVSAWWLRQKLIAGRCDDEAERLAYFENQAKDRPRYSIDNIAARLAKLREDDPDVYADPKINCFEARLKSIVSENGSRTNQIAAVLVELEAMRDCAWSNGVETASVTGRISLVESLLAKDDDAFRSRYLSVKDSWLDHEARLEKTGRERATKFHATLVSHLKAIAARLSSELARKELKKEVAECQASLEEWKKVHSRFAEELSGALSETEKAFNDAIEEQRAYTNALGRLDAADGAEAALEARKDLVESFGGYPETKLLKPICVELDEVKDVLSPEPSAVKAFLAANRRGVSKEEFDTFRKDMVLAIKDSPAYYSLYGLRRRGDASKYVMTASGLRVNHTGDERMIGVSLGRPTFGPSYGEKDVKITNKNDLFIRFDKRGVESEINGNTSIVEFMLPSSVEMRELVGFADNDSLEASSFAARILSLIDRHIREGRVGGSALIKDGEKYYPKVTWRSPYRRVQIVAMYMRWLRDDLKMMPNDKEFEEWYSKFDGLASQISVDGIDDDRDVSWLCVWEQFIRNRNESCERLLKKAPFDWAKRSEAAGVIRREAATVGGWKVMYAGKIRFDPTEPRFAMSPEDIIVSAPNVEADHPLYVLRKVKGEVSLVRAFEPGKNSPWRRCVDVERTDEGYLFGEPLYHVFAHGKFIDVQEELGKMAGRAGNGKPGVQLPRIPLYGKVGN